MTFLTVIPNFLFIFRPFIVLFDFQDYIIFSLDLVILATIYAFFNTVPAPMRGASYLIYVYGEFNPALREVLILASRFEIAQLYMIIFQEHARASRVL